MSDSVRATIHSGGYVEVTNGILTKKISIKDYVDQMKLLVAEEDQIGGEDPFRYPRSIHSVTRTNQGFIVNLYYDEREAELHHTSAGKHTVYMPNVMIRVPLIRVNGTEGEFSFGTITWYCTDKARNELPTEWPSDHSSLNHIWTLPLPNMYNSARMCTGSNRLPSVIYHDWTVLDTLYEDLLIRSKFNNDLSINCVEDSYSPGEWITHLGASHEDPDVERFPYHELINY